VVNIDTIEAALNTHAALGNIADWKKQPAMPGVRFGRNNPRYQVILASGEAFEAASGIEVGALVAGLDSFATAQARRDEQAKADAQAAQAAAEARREAEREFDLNVIGHDGCETCDAEAGDRCVAKGVKYASHPHKGRSDKYLAAQAARELVAA